MKTRPALVKARPAPVDLGVAPGSAGVAPVNARPALFSARVMPISDRVTPVSARVMLIARLALVALGLALNAACSLLPSSRPAAPIADRAIDLDGRCEQTEADGFHERARLLVQSNRVEALSWEIDVGRRGICRFDQGDFRQTRSRPHIELTARDGSGCRLLVWQEPRRITLAHADCANSCQPPGIVEQAWPAMFDPRTGGCARNL